MYLGMDGSPIYSDDLSRRNSEVYRLTTTLYNSSIWGTTVEEQANVCLALLKGYSASFIDHGENSSMCRRYWGVAGIPLIPFLPLCWNSVCLRLVMERFSMSLWPTRAVPSSPLGIPYHLLPNSRKRLMSFRMWQTIPIRGNISMNKTFHYNA